MIATIVPLGKRVPESISWFHTPLSRATRDDVTKVISMVASTSETYTNLLISKHGLKGKITPKFIEGLTGNLFDSSGKLKKSTDSSDISSPLEHTSLGDVFNKACSIFCIPTEGNARQNIINALEQTIDVPVPYKLNIRA